MNDVTATASTQVFEPVEILIQTEEYAVGLTAVCAGKSSSYLVTTNRRLFVCLWPPLGLGLLTHEVSRSHTTTQTHSAGLLWTSDQLVAETST